MDELTNYTQEEFREIFEEQYLREIRNISKTVNPVAAYILGGQPGAGKTALISRIKNKLENAIVISGDDYRYMHPRFEQLYKEYGADYVEHTKMFASQMVEQLISKCSSEGYNLIIEGTLRTAETPIKTANILLSKRYKVNLAVLAVNPTISYVSTIKRYEKMREDGLIPRAVTKEDHDVTVNKIVQNLGKIYDAQIFDNIFLYNRDGKCLYNMGNTPDIRPEKILSKEHHRPFTKHELVQCKNDIQYIKDCLETREDKGTAIYKQHCDAVKDIDKSLKHSIELQSMEFER